MSTISEDTIGRAADRNFDYVGFPISRRTALRGFVGTGLLALGGVGSAGTATATPSIVSLVQSDTDSPVTGVGTGAGTDMGSAAAAYAYLVDDATFTDASASAVPSTYHEYSTSLAGSFTDARWIWAATGMERPADELIRVEETFSLADLSGPFTLRYAADNYAVVLLNGSYLGGGVEWDDVTSVDVSGLLVQGENTLEMRAWNAYHAGVASPAGAIYELLGPAQPTTIALDIDVKPGNGDEVDPINPNAKGNIPVAVSSTADFDATTLDVSTLRFGSAAAVDAGAGASAAHAGHPEDVDGDGLLDLVLHFPTAGTGFQPGDEEAKLVGETADGDAVVGVDAVRTVGGRGRGRGR